MGALASIIASGIGAKKGEEADERTDEERKEYNDSTMAAIGNLLVPGMAAYNMRRTGAGIKSDLQNGVKFYVK